MNKVYIHDTNYDLSRSIMSGDNVYKFVRMDQETGNILTIGVRMGKRIGEQVLGERKVKILEDEMTLIFLKYEFASAAVSASPMVRPLTTSVSASPVVAPLALISPRFEYKSQSPALPPMSQISPIISGLKGIPPVSPASPTLHVASNP